MTRRVEIRLASAVKLSLTASIVLVTIALGRLAYKDLYTVILEGFDRKLEAISSATGSFIDGDDHRLLEQPSDVYGLTFDSERGELLGFDVRGRRLVTLDAVTGLAEPGVPFALGDIAGLAFDRRRGYPVALGGSGWLLNLDRARGRPQPIGDIGRDDCLGLAYEASADAFYCAAGTTLLRLDAESAAAEAVGELDGFFRWLAPGPPGWLWGFDVEAQRVRAIELPRDWRREDGGSRRGGKRRGAQRRGEEGDDGAPSPPPAPPIELTPDVAAGGVRGLAAGSEGGGLWVAADRLLRLEDDGVEPLGLSGFRSEHSPIYRRYVGPIQRIREATGITYLYTQIPHDDPAYCVYILDGGAGEERIELGSVDPLPEESSLGQRQVLHRGEIYISDVVQWEQWGLLKVAFAPIFDRRGESSALAGADVNISIIEDKTRASLLRVLGTGALSLVLGLVLAVDIARRITGPVATVKEAALALAAGRFTEPVERSHLVELSRLSSALDDVGGTLEGTMSHLERSHGELEHRRCLREMADHLDRRIEEDSADAELEMIHRGDGARTTSGVAVGPAGTLAWFAPPAADLAEASRRRHDVHRIVRRQLERPTPGAAPLAEAPWSELFPDWIHGFVFRPRGRDRLEWCARRPLAVIGPDGARPALPTDLDGDGALDLAPRGWVVVGPPDGAGAGAAASAPPAGDPPELADWLGRDPGAPAGPYVIMTAAASPANPGPTAQGPSLP